METIKEDYVSFETAKLLKEKGFDGFCERFYDYYPETGEVYICGCDEHDNSRYDDEFSMPTQQMAMRWLREVHNIDIIAPPQYDNSKWTYSAIIFKLLIPCTEIRLNDNKDKKEQACESAIKYCLENLI